MIARLFCLSCVCLVFVFLLVSFLRDFHHLLATPLLPVFLAIDLAAYLAVCNP